MSNGHIHKDLKGKRLGISILLNILITIAQVIGGLISGSLSLLSDALHNFSDVISLLVSYIANLLKSRKYTVEKTFGYKRVEIVAAFINAATLIIIAIYLIYISGKLLIESLKVLLLFTPSNILISDINSKICQLAEIKNIHHIHLWQLNDKSIHFEAHVDFNENISISEFESILAKIEKILFKNFNIQHCILQPEFKRKDKKDIIVQE